MKNMIVDDISLLCCKIQHFLKFLTMLLTALLNYH